MNSSRRDKEIQEYSEDKALVEAVIMGSRQRMTEARGIAYRHDCAPAEELTEIAATCIKLGYMEVLIRKFLSEHSDLISPDWLIRKRKEIGLHGKDMRWDMTIVSNVFPEVRWYYPKEGISKEETLAFAKIEASRAVRGKGTVIHDMRMREKYPHVDSEERKVVHEKVEDGKSEVRRIMHYVDETAERRVLSVLNVGSEEEEDICGRGVTLAFLHLTKRFGPRAATLWALQIAYEDKFETIIRKCIDPDVDPVTYENIRRTLWRKLDSIKDAIRELADDPEMKELLKEWRAK